MIILKWLSAITWELPQTFFGLLFLIGYKIFLKTNSIYVDGAKVIVPFFNPNNLSSFSLGHFIFLNKEALNEYVYKHECGHSIQSYITGPLYLVVIAIPSIIHWEVCNVEDEWDNYYGVFPENWANYLGGN